MFTDITIEAVIMIMAIRNQGIIEDNFFDLSEKLHHCVGLLFYSFSRCFQ